MARGIARGLGGREKGVVPCPLPRPQKVLEAEPSASVSPGPIGSMSTFVKKGTQDACT